MLSRRGERRTRRIHLRLRCIGLRASVVQLLLGDQPGLRLRGLQQPVVVRLQRGVARLGAADFVLRDADLLLAALLLGLAAAILRVQLRDFEHRERLAGVDAVADIDIDVAYVAGDLRVHIDHLVGLELPGKREHVRDVAALHHADRGRDGLRRGIRGVLMASTSADADDQRQKGGDAS